MCAGHAGLGKLDPAEGGRRNARVQKAKAAQRAKTLKDRLAEGLEARANEIIAAYERALAADDGYKAAEAWISRVYGKPTEHVQTEDVSDPEQWSLAELVKRAREAAEQTN